MANPSQVQLKPTKNCNHGACRPRSGTINARAKHARYPIARKVARLKASGIGRSARESALILDSPVCCDARDDVRTHALADMRAGIGKAVRRQRARCDSKADRRRELRGKV